MPLARPESVGFFAPVGQEAFPMPCTHAQNGIDRGPYRRPESRPVDLRNAIDGCLHPERRN